MGGREGQMLSLPKKETESGNGQKMKEVMQVAQTIGEKQVDMQMAVEKF